MIVSSLGHLIIEGYGVSLRKKRGRLLVVSSEGKWEFAFKNLREIIITGKASISTDLLKALAFNGVDLIVTTYTGTPLVRLVPARAGGTVRNRVEQYKCLEDGRGCIIARDLIVGKGRNQASNLRYYSKARSSPSESRELYEKASMIKELVEKLKNYEPHGDLRVCREEIMAYEAQIANIYWDAMKIVYGEYGFRERLKKPDIRESAEMDIVNLSLNIGYNLLAGSLWKYVLRFGLDPFMGFLHAERPGRLSLVYDLIEPYRPILDRFIASLLRTNTLKQGLEPKKLAVILREKYYKDFLNYKLKYRGRKYRLETIMFLYVEDLVSFLIGRKSHVSTPYIAW
ncbi:MAG: CRISPR-associated endonuclease Cas1 [Desulfurococcales archaeon ex4484_58]|nr:MAG: CRISPR-associated endonuclease Cas1 [Desulfurococcales archaeon ex4484_58]